mmetsp:Transcript_32921/g.64571  ORF Transcript_32921/g.64571 Transcript_32921/m.64571 type:complete len:675 (+) Transcript_32921:34-2058(+)|eukprot:CAMPEP_0175140712 /NCGR_PEP_ID=MMETSP0087-20121206/11678_1 /TAXON_ID=136419 /ORGANISM="Unknown Unknown, Strain D1" /LENGTH=674 /DNA_ID=CAMNT_0016423999 /DNA_START=11 /DNA_END=2035 /DNA_ORIENTATION=-
MKVFATLLFVVLLFGAAAADGEKEEGKGEPAAPLGPVIGIDLGTTYSCVGIYRDDRVDIIANSQGDRITPSYVAFTREERLIGQGAKNQAASNPLNTVYDAKRFIGRKWEDKTVQADRALLPFKVIAHKGRPYIQATVQDGKIKKFSPEEISGMVLTRMKEVAEAYLGEKVTSAVVTVPAYFNDAQRQATKDAGKIAGLNILRIINEPTAAAIAYGLDKGHKNRNILVYDLGGGTFDVSMLTIDDGVFEVLATAGDTHLGGEDFDHRIVEYFLKRVKEKHGQDISKRKRLVARLKQAAEHAKRELSTKMQTKVTIDGFLDGEDFSEVFSRAKFEELNKDLFMKTMAPVKKCLKDSGLTKGEVHDIVMVGGSTRIPKIKQLVQKFFEGKSPHTGVNPDEAIAYGAAVQAGILGGQGGSSSKDVLLLDVTPLTVGIQLVGDRFMRFIERNTAIPTKKINTVTTEADHQTSVPIRVYQGERPRCKDNVKLGEFDVTGIPPMRAGEPKVEVQFHIDANGILNVNAKDSASGNSGHITIKAQKDTLDQEEIERMVKEAEEFSKEDSEWLKIAEANTELKSYLEQVSKTLSGSTKGIGVKDRELAMSTVEEAKDWLDNLNGEKRNADDIIAKKKEITDVIDPIFNKMYGGGGKKSAEEGNDADTDADEDEEEDFQEHQEL